MSLNTASPSPAGPGASPFRSDGFGERSLAVEADGSVTLELLRFRRDLAVAPGFEDALRRRVLHLAELGTPGFAPVREVARDGDQLTLVSTHVPGQRLSELSATLPAGLRPAFVTRIIRKVLPALAALESSGPGVVHGALTADRVVLTPDGHVCITEHALGAALKQLSLSPAALWLQFGLIAAADDRGVAIFDARTDVMQLATTALAVLLARPVTLHDVEHRLPALLDEFSALASATPFAAPLRTWLERALRLRPDDYASAADAADGLKNLPAGSGHVPTRGADVPAMAPAAATTAVLPDAAGGHHVETAGVPAAVASKPGRSPMTSIAAALALLAVGEGLVIAWLAVRTPAAAPAATSVVIESPQAGDVVMVDGRPAGATPLQLRVTPGMRAIRLVPAQPAAADASANAAAGLSDAEKRAAAALEQAAVRQRSGGVSIASPIELKVLEGDRVLGSTADGPIVTSAGTHQLDLVNTALGYRSRQTVTIRAGVISRLTVVPPMGRISINAQPWAQVLIDDNAVGDTPLANVAVAVGDHVVTFRHPQLGERRERVTVRADAPARISTSFQRQ